jgi:hypothetical protein
MIESIPQLKYRYETIDYFLNEQFFVIKALVPDLVLRTDLPKDRPSGCLACFEIWAEKYKAMLS